MTATNVRFEYLYRDASNYKRYGSVVFADTDQLSAGLPEIESRIRKSLMTNDNFMAHQVRVPELFLYELGGATEDDHCLHEFFGVETTTHPTDDTFCRSISEFVREVESVSRAGWVLFDPDEA